MQEETGKPRIGLVSTNDPNRHLLAGVLGAAGYDLTVSLDTERLMMRLEQGESMDGQVDAWLLDTGGQDMQRALDLMVDHCRAPLLVNDDIPPPQELEAHRYWKRRLLEKLELVAVPEATDRAPSVAGTAGEMDTLWVLAASFGGPEAIREFLGALPGGLPLAMVYGQHIDKSFDQVLTSALSANRNYPVRLLRGRSQLLRGEIAVVPADRQVRFLARGEAVETRHPWAGPYQPALDQVIAELARAYRQRLGVIVFSGMCSDGEIGCRVAKACGSTVWVQSPASCLSDDMPNAALRTGAVSFQGTPRELALALGEHVMKQADAGTVPEIPTLGAGQA